MGLCVYLMQPLNRSALLQDIGMTPPLTHARPAKSTRFDKKAIVSAALIFGAAVLVFASGLRARFFDDEYADITQSYYADLFFGRQFNDKLWLEPEAFDRQPLPKYLIGLAFRFAGLPMPRPVDARTWYFPSMRKSGSREWGGPETLVAAACRDPAGRAGLSGSLCHRCDGQGCAPGDDRCLFAHDQPALWPSRPSGDVGRALRSLHAVVAGGLAFHVGANLLEGFHRRGHCPALVCGDPGRHVAFMQVQWLPRPRHRRGVQRAHVAATETFHRGRLAVTGATIVTVAVALAVAVAFNPYMTAKPAERGLSSVAASLRAKTFGSGFAIK